MRHFREAGVPADQIVYLQDNAATKHEIQQRFKELRLHNITARLGDGWAGWPEQAPFERIIVTAAPAEIPEALLRQLSPDGIMVLPVGSEKRTQKLLKLTMTPSGYVTEDIAPVRFVPMVAGLPPEASGA